MRLTILGEYGPYPPARGACSGYLISHGQTHILVDCGPGVLSRLQQVIPLGSLSAVVLSHLHSDHMADMGVLRYALALLPGRGETIRVPMPVYCPDSPSAEADFLTSQKVFTIHPLNDRIKLNLEGIQMAFTALNHPVPSFGMLARAGGRSLFYTGDTNEHPLLPALAAAADLFLCDAGLLGEHWSPASPHLSVEKAARLGALCPGSTVLTHLGPGYDREQILAEALPFCPGVRLARSMDTYES